MIAAVGPIDPGPLRRTRVLRTTPPTAPTPAVDPADPETLPVTLTPTGTPGRWRFAAPSAIEGLTYRLVPLLRATSGPGDAAATAGATAGTVAVGGGPALTLAATCASQLQVYRAPALLSADGATVDLWAASETIPGPALPAGVVPLRWTSTVPDVAGGQLQVGVGPFEPGCTVGPTVVAAGTLSTPPTPFQGAEGGAVLGLDLRALHDLVAPTRIEGRSGLFVQPLPPGAPVPAVPFAEPAVAAATGPDAPTDAAGDGIATADRLLLQPDAARRGDPATVADAQQAISDAMTLLRGPARAGAAADALPWHGRFHVRVVPLLADGSCAASGAETNEVTIDAGPAAAPAGPTQLQVLLPAATPGTGTRVVGLTESEWGVAGFADRGTPARPGTSATTVDAGAPPAAAPPAAAPPAAAPPAAAPPAATLRWRTTVPGAAGVRWQLGNGPFPDRCDGTAGLVAQGDAAAAPVPFDPGTWESFALPSLPSGFAYYLRVVPVAADGSCIDAPSNPVLLVLRGPQEAVSPPSTAPVAIAPLLGQLVAYVPYQHALAAPRECVVVNDAFVMPGGGVQLAAEGDTFIDSLKDGDGGSWTGYWLFGARPGEQLLPGRQGCVEPRGATAATQSGASAVGCGEVAAVYGTAVGCATARATARGSGLLDSAEAVGALVETLVARSVADLRAALPDLPCGAPVVSPTGVRPDEVVGAEPTTACGQLAAAAVEAGIAAPSVPADLPSVTAQLDAATAPLVAALAPDDATRGRLTELVGAIARRAAGAVTRNGATAGGCAGLGWCSTDSGQRLGLAQVRVTRSLDDRYTGLPNADVVCLTLRWEERDVRATGGVDAYRTRCAAVPQLAPGASTVLTFALVPDTAAARREARLREGFGAPEAPLTTPVRRCEITHDPASCRVADRVALEVWHQEVFQQGGQLLMGLTAWARAAGSSPTTVAPVLARTTLVDALQASGSAA